MTELQKEAHLVYTLLFVFLMMFGFVVAITIGYRKTIGYFWSFFFCLVFTPFIGLLITSLSKDRITKEPPRNWHVYVFLALLLILLSLALTGIIDIVPDNYTLLLTGWAVVALTGTFFFFHRQKRKRQSNRDILK